MFVLDSDIRGRKTQFPASGVAVNDDAPQLPQHAHGQIAMPVEYGTGSKPMFSDSSM